MEIDGTASAIIFVALVITVGLAIGFVQALGHLQDISSKLTRLIAATEDVADEVADRPSNQAS